MHKVVLALSMLTNQPPQQVAQLPVWEIDYQLDLISQIKGTNERNT